MTDPASMDFQMQLEREQRHADEHPDGCPDFCEHCTRRLHCKNGRHEWPRNFSDGDSCYCGTLYLFTNCVDDRPYVRTR